MEVAKLMTPYPHVIDAAASIQDAALIMRDLNIGILPVSRGDEIIGMVTDRDITVRATAEGLDTFKTPVSRIMTPELFCCMVDEDIRDASTRMLERHVGRLLVVDDKKRVTGIISLGCITAYLGGPELVKYGPMCDFA